jgi:DNA-directed RNA polymerase specialized sigma24 family protein
MLTPDDARSSSESWIVLDLQQYYDGRLEPAEVESLARDIMPYLRRTRHAVRDVLPAIADNYQRDGRRVRELLRSTASPAWRVVLEQVVSYATRHTLFPTDNDAQDWPDLAAFEDIQRKLPTYNFEGPLDGWITVTVTNRLRRFWRDQQALRAGGTGFKSRAAREAGRLDGMPVPAVGQMHTSLEDPRNVESPLLSRLRSTDEEIAEQVESRMLEQVVASAVDTLAAHRDDPNLKHVWDAVVGRQLKLRETAEHFGLSVAQVFRKIELVRTHLRANSHVQHWFDRPG